LHEHRKHAHRSPLGGITLRVNLSLGLKEHGLTIFFHTRTNKSFIFVRSHNDARVGRRVKTVATSVIAEFVDLNLHACFEWTTNSAEFTAQHERVE
jgi:hypothetical protein